MFEHLEQSIPATLVLKGTLNQKELENLIQGSYDKVFAKLSKKKQQELLSL